MNPRLSSIIPDAKVASMGLVPTHERLTELERRSLLAEQAREQAHALRSPLSLIELVSETLQLEIGEDRSRAERIQRVLDAVATLSLNLTQNVRANCFADGPKRPVDAVRLAEEVVLAFGGRVAAGASTDVQDAEGTAEDASVVLADEQGLQAALVHLLRLIGIGYACNGACQQQPVLSVERDQHAQRLRLCLMSEGEPSSPIPTERADFRLMLKAVERVARDNDAALVLAQDHATLELPLAPG